MKTSKMTEQDWKYPERPPSREGHLAVPGHEIHWAEYGSPKGEPVMFFHGGPGGGFAAADARLQDPARYRVVLFDQRGCGKSRPLASDPDPTPALTDNTTAHLIADANALRDELGITGKMHVLGGSWGSTLGLAYAIAHPENVETLILRGIFLCRREDLDYFYQGNADVFAHNPHDMTKPGTYQFFPEAWKNYVEVIPPEERGDMVQAYARIFAARPGDDDGRAYQLRAARAWTVWEGVTSYLSQDISSLDKFGDPVFAAAFARLENHYFMNGCFLGGKSGEANRDNNYLLENVPKIAHIPVHIVQGRYDVVCPMFQAEALVADLAAAGTKNVDYRLTPAGHSRLERENALALTDIFETLPEMPRASPAPGAFKATGKAPSTQKP